MGLRSRLLYISSGLWSKASPLLTWQNCMKVGAIASIIGVPIGSHRSHVRVKGGRITDHWGGGKVYHWSRRWSAIMSAPSELGLRSEVSPRTA